MAQYTNLWNRVNGLQELGGAELSVYIQNLAQQAVVSERIRFLQGMIDSTDDQNELDVWEATLGEYMDQLEDLMERRWSFLIYFGLTHLY